MTALPIHREQRSAHEWVPIDVAAEVLGESEGNLRRKCAALEPRCQAKKILTDGTHKWHIHTSYNPRLRRRALELDDDGNSKLQDLLKTTPAAKLQRAQVDAQILTAFRQLRSSSGSFSKQIPTFIEAMKEKHGRCPGRARLFDLDSRCPASDDIDGIIYELIDRRGRKQGDIQTCSDLAWSAFCDLYLTPQQWSIAKCWRTVRALAEQNDWAWPSLSRVKQLKSERLDPSMITFKREGRDAWNRKHLAPMEQDPNAWEVGQCWESDHSVLDLHIRVISGDKWIRTRPQLTAWLDRRSRRLMGYHISTQGNQLTIRAALLNALRRDDVSNPSIVWIDNGKDFMARSIGGLTKQHRRKTTIDEQREAEQSSSGLLAMLKIEPHFARHYNHNGKARIERFFGTVHGEFDKEFKSYAGYRPGMLDKLDHQATQKDIMSLPTLDEVREKFDEFAQWYNLRREHHIDDLRDPSTQERLSPDEFYNRYLPSKRVVKKDALILLEEVFSTPLKVFKWGVSLRIGNGTVRYGELCPELEPLVGTDARVFVSYDPEDMGTVNIWNEKFEFLCAAQQNGRYGGLANDRIKKQDLQAGFAKRKQASRRLREKIDLVTGTLSDAELSSRMARDREIGETKAQITEFDRTRDPSDIPNLRLVQTPLDHAPDDIESQRMRKAAGAEHHEEDDGYKSIITAARELHLAEEQDEDLGGYSFKAERNPFAEVDDDDDELEGYSFNKDTDLSEFNESNIFSDESFMDHLT
jgi:transposase InsO family protein